MMLQFLNLKFPLKLMSKIQNYCQNPYQLFFPFAILCFLYGCLLWIAHGLFEFGEFPLHEHANIFLGGFLSFSIIGFLLTAIPRFTGSEFLSKVELIFAALIIIFVLMFYFLDSNAQFWLTLFLSWIFVLIFALKRFLKRVQNPPATFLFVGIGVLFGVFGCLFQFLSSTNFFHNDFFNFESWGEILFYDSMVTSFILGVGSRLIPGILGFEDIVKKQRELYEKPLPFLSVISKDIYICATVYVSAIVLEMLGLETFGLILKATVITYFTLFYWRLQEKVKTGKWHGKMLKASGLFMLVPCWLIIFFPENAIHLKHLIYIGSYCLMTLLVASRVVVAHSGESLDIEYRKFPFLLIGVLILFGALTRATAFLLPNSYMRHLGYAAILLLFAAFTWIGTLKRYFKGSNS